jgi:hypothetical protein
MKRGEAMCLIVATEENRAGSPAGESAPDTTPGRPLCSPGIMFDRHKTEYSDRQGSGSHCHISERG